MNTASNLTPPSSEPRFNTADTSQYQPANNNKRVIAFIIDGLISTAISKTIFLFFFKSLHLSAMSQTICNLILALLVVPILYWTLLTLQLGATPGKKMMGLRIVTKSHSTDLSLQQLLLRETIGRLASAIPLCLGYFWVSFNDERKTFHDMIADTRVVDYK
ncbi:MAG: RDD family protein [Pseudobdellovibrio sp.]